MNLIVETGSLCVCDLQHIQIAQQVSARIQNIPGLTNVRIGTQITKPEYQILVDRPRLADAGLSTQAVSQAARNLVDGAVATSDQLGRRRRHAATLDHCGDWRLAVSLLVTLLLLPSLYLIFERR